MRSSFGSSTFVRRLAVAAPMEPEAAGLDFAERLSLWLDAFGAIRLQAAHGAIRNASGAPVARAARTARLPDLAQELDRVRTRLARDIAAAVEADGAAYAPWQRRHLELQRQMELLAAPLRDHARQVLGRASPRLRQLAALDAVLEETLAAREQDLFPAAPALLQRRFEQLRDAGAEGWLDTFAGEWRQLLLAERDLRLEPVAGLVEALRNESTNQQ